MIIVTSQVHIHDINLYHPDSFINVPYAWVGYSEGMYTTHSPYKSWSWCLYSSWKCMSDVHFQLILRHQPTPITHLDRPSAKFPWKKTILFRTYSWGKSLVYNTCQQYFYILKFKTLYCWIPTCLVPLERLCQFDTDLAAWCSNFL